MRCEARTLDDIRALGGNDIADDRRFAAAARVSEINLSLYRTFMQPIVRAMVPAPVADWIRQCHPLRLQYEIFSDQNPFMAPVARLAEQVRANRKNVDNGQSLSCGAGKHVKADRGRRSIPGARQARHGLSGCSSRIYGSPTLQTAVGVDPSGTQRLRKAAKNPLHRELLQKRIAELKALVAVGGLRAAVVRSLIYVGVNRAARRRARL